MLSLIPDVGAVQGTRAYCDEGFFYHGLFQSLKLGDFQATIQRCFNVRGACFLSLKF